MKVLIYGAGSIGNHLAHASRCIGWEVAIVDIDPAALNRTRNDIYPTRYGSWDDSIDLYSPGEETQFKPELVIIGTPPDKHISLAEKALDLSPLAILIEKPLCPPSRDGLSELSKKAKILGIKIFVGYDHVVGLAAERISQLIKSQSFGEIITIDVEFREHWGGIFAAHPWLKGPEDTYLGFWEKGGGATGEHSHSLNLWQYFANLTNAGEVVTVEAIMDFVEDGKCKYDRISLMNLKTNNNLIGRVVQDVVTNPPRKQARLQFEHGFIEWSCTSNLGYDSVTYIDNDMSKPVTEKFKKTRPDDFIKELKHINHYIENKISDSSPICLEKGCDTMSLISAAYESAQAHKPVNVQITEGK